MDEAERVAEEIAEALANNEAHLLADCALMTRSDKIIVASILRNELEAARREAFEEAARIVGPDDALYAGPYPAEVCDVIAGVLLSRAAAIRERGAAQTGA